MKDTQKPTARPSDAELKALSDSFESQQPWDLLEYALKTYRQRIVLACSMARNGLRVSASLLTVQLREQGRGTRLLLTEQGAFLDRQDSSAAREKSWRDLLAALGRELESRA